MARILLGWEFGANRGHAVRLAGLAAALRGEGHEIAFAVQRIDALTDEEAAGAPVWQAPISPRLLVSGAVPGGGPPAGMADILARLGMDDPRLVAAMVRGWRQVFAAARAELVVAEFAPFLLLAARGRLPTIAVGTGFSVPPPTMADFPPLVEGMAGIDQATVLEALNAGLKTADAAPVAALPQVFAADRAIPATFAELDPYAQARAEPPARPIAEGFAAEAGAGEEVFAYAPERVGADSPLWAGLAAAGVPVRVHVPRASAAKRAALARLGFAVEPEPLPFAAIASRSRLLVSHGGHGIACAALAAGLPHIVVHYDLEKLLTGLALARLGLGGHASLAALAPQPFGESLGRIHRDDALAGRARAAAPGFRGRAGAPLEQATTEAAAALA